MQDTTSPIKPMVAAAAGTIRAEMARRRNTTVDLAAHLGVGRATLARRLAGEVEFKPSEILALSRKLGIDAQTLLEAYDDNDGHGNMR